MGNNADRSPDDESSTRPFWPFGGDEDASDAAADVPHAAPASPQPDSPSDATRAHGPEETTHPQRPADTTEVHRPADTTEVHRPGDTTEVHRPGDTTEVYRRGDETQAQRPGDTTQEQRPGDTTRVQRPEDATRVQRPGDATRVQRPGDATRVQGAGGGATWVEEPADRGERWSARAGVPAPGDPSLRRSAPQEWVEEEEDPYQGRSWFAPVIVGMVALVLVAALAVGLYLIYRATANGQNAPGGVAPPAATTSASPPAPASSAPPSPSAEPSSEAPPPTSAGPPAGQVVIPQLRGNTLAEATVKLQVLGLNVEVQRRADDSVQPGEVIATRPGEGTTVAAGDTVTLIVAAPASAPPSPTPSASASG
ncbi:PASTA domain-containing protein [Dactylosporangium sp. NPDC051485]|uniref:PASTA domain-containing protein n=1 Tax=Dactylosporangium sp. NPDC051485 TaxID=3154846 RepID=UPI003427B464